MKKINMFRLNYLKLIEHPQLGNIELSFSEENDIIYGNKFYTSVIIGSNGTGKSYILRTIIDLFRELYELKNKGKRKKYVIGKYNLKYSISGRQYCYTNIREYKSNDNLKDLWPNKPSGSAWRERGITFFIEKDGKSINEDEIEIPEAILASSIMLTDKYIFLSKPEEFQNYKYLGIRASRSTSGTRSYIKNTINYLANSTEKGVFIKTLPKILSFLELEDYLSLSFSVRHKDTFFTGDISKETFVKFIDDYEIQLEERRKKESKYITPWFAFQHYKNLLKDESLLYTLIEFCNRKVQKLGRNSSSGKYFFEYNLLEDLISLETEISFINLLEKLNLIGYPELCFRKKGTESYNFEGASSGEAHFISSMIGILATITQDSLILIDEPEISLHPNWQMKYMNFLNEILGGYSSCHFIIATHSHFLISDLKGDNSRILGLRREDGRIRTVDLPSNLDTYGWSAEEVLYRIFNVRSTRNSFLEYDLTKLVTMINRNSNDFSEITRILNKISTLVLSDNDPLKILREKAEQYLERNND